MIAPTFLVAGVAKAGTTYLHRALRAHPEVFVPAVKETNFFSDPIPGRAVPQDVPSYLRRFAGAGDARAVGEVSPRYAYSEHAAQRIAVALPDVRIVIALREPADRAWSDHLGRARILRERRPPAIALRAGEETVQRGFYAAQLQRFYDRFPRENIHVLLHDDLVADIDATLRTLWRFLGVDADVPAPEGRANAAATPRSARLNRVLWPAVDRAARLVPVTRRGSGLGERALRRTYAPPPPFPDALRSELRALYRDDVLATAALIGRDLSPWLE